MTAFLLPLIGLGTIYALQSNRNDVKSWLPAAYEETKTFKWYWDHFEGDAFIMASWDGCTLGNEKVAHVANALRKQNDAEEKANGSRLFLSITTGEELLNQLIDQRDLSREEALKRLRGSVVGLDEKQTCVLLTISPKEIENWDARKHPGRQSKSAIFHAAVGRVYEAAELFGIGRDEIHLGGPPVDNVAIDVEGERSMIKLAIVCGLIGLVMSWWTLRSWRFTLIVFTTALFSAGAESRAGLGDGHAHQRHPDDHAGAGLRRRGVGRHTLVQLLPRRDGPRIRRRRGGSGPETRLVAPGAGHRNHRHRACFAGGERTGAHPDLWHLLRLGRRGLVRHAVHVHAESPGGLAPEAFRGALHAIRRRHAVVHPWHSRRALDPPPPRAGYRGLSGRDGSWRLRSYPRGNLRQAHAAFLAQGENHRGLRLAGGAPWPAGARRSHSPR